VVRTELDNPEGLLLPNMYVDVSISADLGEALTVPNEAVIVTGTRRLVFVDRGDSRLVPQEVEVGRRGGDWVEIRSGLVAGDKVVSSGAFLIAAESRLRAAERYWGAEHVDE
jgi:Cu(I)/Ag(I) efflux system membrane fusion protein